MKCVRMRTLKKYFVHGNGDDDWSVLYYVIVNELYSRDVVNWLKDILWHKIQHKTKFEFLQDPRNLSMGFYEYYSKTFWKMNIVHWKKAKEIHSCQLRKILREQNSDIVINMYKLEDLLNTTQCFTLLLPESCNEGLAAS